MLSIYLFTTQRPHRRGDIVRGRPSGRVKSDQDHRDESNQIKTIGTSQIRSASHTSMARPASKTKQKQRFSRVVKRDAPSLSPALRFRPISPSIEIPRFGARSLSEKLRALRRRAPLKRALYCTLARNRLQRISPSSSGNSPTNFRNVQPVKTFVKDSAGSPADTTQIRPHRQRCWCLLFSIIKQTARSLGSSCVALDGPTDERRALPKQEAV